MSCKECPFCNNFVTKNKDLRTNYVQCPFCIKNNPGSHKGKFCWLCLKPWIGATDEDGDKVCGNKDC